ncbi:MAG: hypothetical protein H6732_16525 [Alphaproteobacteria bacterium]|nr:hypothetical protein [Alphaproteobacteria bacterium]
MGHAHVGEHPEAEDELACVAQVQDGTVPNQPVTITYEGRLAGQAYDPTPRDGDGFGARIDLDSFLVIWR